MTTATFPPGTLHHGHRVLMKGNEAMAEAAIRAGCDAYFGYPITPQAELLEWMARRMPEEGRPFVQAESELGAINMALGAAATGARVLVSSSSPGISLMAEAMSYMAGAEIPMVLVNVMRGGPGLGGIGPSQADYFQATKGHGHGDYRVPVLAPSSIGEAMALMADAFELAERYRTPVFILADGTLGQAMEPVELHFREPARAADGWAVRGADGRRPRVVKSMHLEPEDLEQHNRHLQAKFAEIAAREIRWAGENLEGADLVIVAYGTAARVARTAIARARAEGLRVGSLPPDHALAVPVRGACGGCRARPWHPDRRALGRPDGGGRPPRRRGTNAGGVRGAHRRHDPDTRRGRRGAAAPRRRDDRHAGRDDQGGPAMTTDAPAGARVIFDRPELLTDRSTHYCPGCGHGVVHRLIAEVLGELGLGSRTIAVAPVGCAVFAYDYIGVDFVEAPHGRAPAVATGIRRVRPEAFVLTYQGDGDLAAIGTAEIIHAAGRGELLTAVFVNNGIYGMTGGQMAPTTLLGQRSTSSPGGREASFHGYPIPMTEMLAIMPGVAYAARGSVADAPAIGRTKQYLRRACEVQLEGRGFAIVEVISNCPVGWGMTPTESIERLRDVVAKQYRPGVIVDRTQEG